MEMETNQEPCSSLSSTLPLPLTTCEEETRASSNSDKRLNCQETLKKRRERDAERKRLKRQLESEEDRAVRMEKDRQAKAKRAIIQKVSQVEVVGGESEIGGEEGAQETLGQCAAQKDISKKRTKREMESTEATEVRLEKARERMRELRKTRTPDELKKSNDTAKKAMHAFRETESAAARQDRLEKTRLSMEKKRQNLTEEQQLLLAAKDRERVSEKRNGESEADRQERLEKVRMSMEERRANLTEEQQLLLAAKDRERISLSRETESEADRLERLEKVRMSMEERRANLTEEQQLLLAVKDRERISVSRETESEADRQDRLEKMRLSMKERRANQTQETQSVLAQKDCARKQVVRQSLSQQEKSDRRGAAKNGMRVSRVRSSSRRASSLFKSGKIQAHYLGKLDRKCFHCGALFFESEVVSDTKKINICCSSGTAKLPSKFDDFPKELHDLLIGDSHDAKNFQGNIRQFNSALAMASMGAQIDVPPGNGPPVFKVHGQIYHHIGSLHPPAGKSPTYGQLYILDSAQAARERCASPFNEKCDKSIMESLSKLISEVNVYATAFKMMYEVEEEEEARALLEDRQADPVRMIFDVNAKNLDLRRYNDPRVNEVAVVYVGEDSDVPSSRSIAIHSRHSHLQELSELNPALDALTYPIFFPRGQSGWHPHMEHVNSSRKRNRVTQKEFYGYLLQVRDEFNPIHFGRNLFQQFAVDTYVKIEQNRLRFHRTHQKELRADEYRTLKDHVDGDSSDGPPGRRVILPSSFPGSPRAMMQDYQDAMAIVTRHGKPDLFLTMTCNPTWCEIVDNLAPGQHASDRPDLVSRVFKLKVDALFEDLLKHHVLGEVQAFVMVYEWQKRGLPHVHVLLTLKEAYKLKTNDDIDRLISAEIPDPIDEPVLHAIVTKQMMHRPCGTFNPTSPCMRDGKCTKRFPKDFADHTTSDLNGYPLYKRRDDGRSVLSGRQYLTNQHVVPYNRDLLLRYSSHINVEVCALVEAVKYLFKYVYKGNDRAAIRLQREAESGKSEVNEIDIYLDCRYVCAPESIHHIFGFPCQRKSDVVYRLSVHLPDRQTVTYDPADPAQAALNAERKGTTLTAWFKMNKHFEHLERDGADLSGKIDSRCLLYAEMPEHFVFSKSSGKWTTRLRGNRQIGRMFSAHPGDPERFALRLLLLHVKGATSFESLRTVRDDDSSQTVHDSFVAAAKARGLLNDDTQYVRTLDEVSGYQMPVEMRGVFCAILAFCEIGDPQMLWEHSKKSLCEDFLYQGFNADESEARAWFDIEKRLQRLGKSLDRFLSRPNFVIPPSPIDIPDFSLFASKGDQLYSTLNLNQKVACDQIMASLDDPFSSKLFYLDGPGGSGKTYTYTTVYHMMRGKELVVQPIAWTGIASTLLPEGRTAASVFKLDINKDCKESLLKRGSKEAKYLQTIDAFILDEASMVPKHALETMDNVLRDLMDNSVPFGGKTVILGGDFRQVLPVVRRGTRADQVNICIKRSDLWKEFKVFSLKTNMRVVSGDGEWTEFLLRVGDGSANDESGEIELPSRVESNGNLVEEIFGDRISTSLDISDSAILAPKNVDVDSINHSVHVKMDGEEKVYFSRDEVPDDSANKYLTTEFLNSLKTSSLPPHRLALKVGSVVMLLRNLDVSSGLCNGARLVVMKMGHRTITCRFATGESKGKVVVIPKIDNYEDKNLAFRLKRTQFPVRLAFALSINKAQGQSYGKIGLWLPDNVFAHGQLYVALSRVRSTQGLKVHSTNPHPLNVVYHEVL